MNLIFKSLLLVLVVIANSLQAAEISKIRFGKTEQRARLVIESDEVLTVNQSWLSGKLIVTISGLEQRPLNRKISPSALSMIEKMQWTEEKSLLQITLPINQQNFIKWFKIDAEKSNPHRLVIDWSPSGKMIFSQPIARLEPNKFRLKPKLKTNIRIPSDKVTNLVIEAKKALTDKNYPYAISLLTKLLKQGDLEQKAFALEFLGVARERNYQLAFAKQYYQRFLKDYPDFSSAPRVKQRLAALIGIQEINQKKPLKKGTRFSGQKKSNTRASVATDYRQSELVNDLGESRQTLSLLGVDIDVRGDYQLDASSVQFRFSGGHYQDFSDGGGATNDRLRYANMSWQSGDQKYSINFGRQRSRGKGIFGRYDGLLIGYGVNDDQRINLVAGAPVASSKVLSLDPERTFIGLSYDWEDLFKNIDVNFFVLHQTIDSLTDRQALGGELRYFNQGTSIFSLIDYDIFYSELNAFLFSASHTTANKTRYHWSFNQRKSPYISTRNALIGQAADSLQELQELFLSDEEILDLATDRTLESQTSTLQISQPLNKTYDISGSLTWLTLSGAPASGGVAEITEPGSQLYFNLYLRGARLYSKGDSNQLGLRMSQLSSSDVWSIYVTSKYRWAKSWSISAKLRFDDRENHAGGGQQNISPSFRLQYQDRQQYVYADFGAILYTNQVEGLSDISTDIYYTYIGYRYFF